MWKVGESRVLSHRHPQKYTHNEQYEQTPERKSGGIFPSIFHVYTWYRNPLWSEVKVAQLCLFVAPWTAAFPGPSVHGILQAKILEWVAVSSSRRSSQPRDRNQVSRVADRFLTIWAIQRYSLLSNKQQGQDSAYKSVMSFKIHIWHWLWTSRLH